MRIIADLHIHSKYSRATSPQMQVDVLDIWAKKKGIDILATGDSTHPDYLKELKEKLVENGSGLLKLKSPRTRSFGSVRGRQIPPHQSRRLRDGTGQAMTNNQTTSFMLSGEISCIYTDKGQVRRLHILVLAPNFATVDKINKVLKDRGCNLHSDGRPIIGLSAKQLAQICFEANEKTLVIPAHAWTPWFAIFGSKSGYDSIEECYEELSPKIYAIETGLSSDPAMNWRLSKLDRVVLVSNSDAHSPANLGREANVFDLSELTYEEIYQTLKNKDKKKFLYTIEFFPQEGKYHYDGHMACKFVCAPNESKRKKNICPVCKKELTLGVDHRVDDLADRELGFRPKGAIPYKSVVPLQEIIAECLDKPKTSKYVQAMYEEMVKMGGSEFNILLDLNEAEIKKISSEIIAEAIGRMRRGEVFAEPGYDGKYGVIKVFSGEELAARQPKQKNLF